MACKNKRRYMTRGNNQGRTQGAKKTQSCIDYLKNNSKSNGWFLTNDDWKVIKKQIKKELNLTDISYYTWIEPLELYLHTKKDIVVGIKCSDIFCVHVIHSKYWSKIEESLRRYVGQEPEIKLCMVRELE
ncbi:hypothetical protein bpr_IV118 (plasmid) [Butyrivibrio proteoclasticus B316]|uniref:DnaA N-terminal domain-containing protein n=1 Tax=Butyrivibrio proteoclasticus (strain ATCC 51982 / DSM 14932 / B316) TaxID=515622 RepID=E0S501_BUTPB|nr:hypothetical protein [Butyrivibrio proteoclasticus]ADL36483.1 hypothetical protein bpr_IV118 [Butyrivibrio proteoclasticus B316]